MLYIASDHAGYQLKKRLVRFLENKMEPAVAVEDLGPTQYHEDDDYPDYAIPLAKKVAEAPEEHKGILICGNGVGVCMAANKVKGIRAGIGYNTYAADSMRQDDNTNVLCLGARALSEEYALAVVRHWLEAQFSGAQRHVRRLKKVAALEA